VFEAPGGCSHSFRDFFNKPLRSMFTSIKQQQSILFEQLFVRQNLDEDK